MVLFNGTNAEDRVDPTRVGLVAAALLHDVGHLPDGRPFYTMRVVTGRDLHKPKAAPVY